MKKQNGSVILIILILLLLIISNPVMAQSSLDDLNKINFASFKTYTDEITREIPIILLTEYLDSGEIYASIVEDIIDFKTSRKLTGERLQIQTQTMLEPEFIFKQPVLIDIQDSLIDHNGKQGVLLSLFFTVYPEDLPGNYETILIFSENPEDEEGLEIELSFRVEPWLKVEAEEIHLIADGSQIERSLVSNFPGTLRFFTNVPWELIVESDENSINLATELELKLFKDRTEDFEILSDSITLGERKIPVATGGPTVFTDKGYTELAFAMIIEDYTKVEAGQIRFPLSFSLESIE